MRRWSVGTALVVMLVAAVAASAAEQGGGGRGQGGRGPGGQRGGGPGGPGFGMGMMGGGFGGGGNLMMLVGIEEVQKEIEMLDDQKEGVRKIAEAMRAERGERPNFGNFAEMSEEERAKAMDQVTQQMRERAKASKAKLAEVLLPHQIARLEEISLQQQGTMALADADVAQKLAINDEQKKKLETTMRESGTAMGEKMRELFQSGDREGMRDRMTALRKEMDQKVLANLTPEQQKKFEELKGKEFKMPEMRFGGPGGPGGGRRGGEGGGEGRPKRPAKE